MAPKEDEEWQLYDRPSGSLYSQSPLTLSSVIRLRPPDETNIEPSVISVPGYCTPPAADWGAREELNWAAGPINSVSNLHMYIYNPSYGPVDEFSWEAFLKRGSDLAEDLARLAAQFPHRPIIFIAHSLGGALLKKALLLAHQNLQDPRFKLVVDCLSGILFLGTPNAGVSDEDTLLRHNQVLYSCTKTGSQKQSSKHSRNDVYQLANLAATFEQIANVPILSVFEYADRRTGIQTVFGKKNKALVDAELAKISSNAEHLLGVHLTHSELCKLPMLRDQSYSARDFLRRLFEDLAANKRASMETKSSPIVRAQVPNPLNPLNLVPISPTEAAQNILSRPRVEKIDRAPSITSSLKESLRLPILSTRSRSRLLENRKCHLPCFMVSQPPNANFVGREDVFQLIDKHLLPPKSSDSASIRSPRFFALCGMGGIGKTELANQYAFSRQKKFGAVFWLEAGGVSQLATDFGRIPSKLGLETPEEATNLESSIAMAKAWLSEPESAVIERSEERETDAWLLIFDNADNLDVITDYVPYGGNGSILVTSRDPFAKDHFFSNGSGKDMELLSRAESAILLGKLISEDGEVQSTNEKDALSQIVRQFDGLPLAVTQMAGFIRRRHLSGQEFMSLYGTDARYAEIHNLSSPVQQHRYGYTLATTYNFEDLSPTATTLLQLLAFMNPDRIQESIFLGQGSVESKAAGQWQASTFESARYELLSCSLVSRNIQRRELWIHRVIQAEVRVRLDEGRRYHVFKDAVYLLMKIWPPGNLASQASKRWALCEDLLPHLERLYQLYVEYSRAWDNFEVDIPFPTIMNEAAVYLHERGYPHEGKPYLRLALSLCARNKITTEPLVSDMHLTMGALSNETNDAQACLEHNILCLTIRQDLATKSNKPDVRLAFAYSQMGIAYMMMKKFALATQYFQQSVELLKTVDPDPDEFGFPVCNLGCAFWIQDELEAADKVLTDLLAQREKLHGKLDKVSYKTGRVLQALGNVKSSKAMQLEARGDYEGAEGLWNKSFEIHTDCLKQYESTLGSINHRTADACHKLAEHHIRRKEHTLAQDYLDRALSIWGDRQWFANESARSSFLRGTHLVSIGGERNQAEGYRWIERAKVLRHEILPQEEPKELTTEDFDDIVCFWSI